MRLFGIIGFPLGHSFSQAHFSEKFSREKLADHEYRKFELRSIDELPGLLEREKELAGFNVTIPYKVEVLKYLDEIDKEALAIGAVNTVRVTHTGGKSILKGFNTDAPAFRRSLTENLTSIPETAIVLGTGGASRSVVHTLQSLNIKTVVISRKAAAGDYTYDTLPDEIIRTSGLIVNTTPSGMAPDVKNAPAIDYSQLHHGQLLFDLIYNPPVTLFLEKGGRQGCSTVNGEMMFRYQAELAWQVWNGKIR